jgi:starvation-inducible DNA-binding protein
MHETAKDRKDAGARRAAALSLIEVWIDETERRTWFLFEAGRSGAALV